MSSLLKVEDDKDVYDYENARANPKRYSDMRDREVIQELNVDIESFKTCKDQDLLSHLDSKDVKYLEYSRGEL